MQTVQHSRLLTRCLLLSVVAAGSVGVACGQATSTGAARNAMSRTLEGPMQPRKISKVHQPVGTPHKVSSFAPRPTSQRVFGSPIAPPIVHNAPARKPAAPK
jgi:hypothetical protein